MTKIDIKIRHRQLHTDLLVLKAILNHKNIEKTIQFLYNFYQQNKDNAVRAVNVKAIKKEELFKDLEEIKAISHPSHTQKMIDKWRDLLG